MKKFALYNYQFERIVEPDDELKLEFPNWKYVNPDESFEHKQELFGQLFPTDAIKMLPFEFWCGKKFYIHKLIIPPTEDGIVVFNLSNKKIGHRTNANQEKEDYDDYPYVMIIIDNRPGVQRILIEQNGTVFRDPKTPAKILQTVFNKQLRRYLLTIELYAQYPAKDFWKEVHKHPEGFRKVIFHLPHLNLERLAKVTDKYFNVARQDWDSELDFAFTAPKGGVVRLDENNLRQKALTECMSMTGMPTSSDKRSIEMVTAGETKKHIWVGRDSYLTIHLADGIVGSLTSSQLEAFNDENPVNRLTKKLDEINENN
jgi:hypothetical protein